MRNSIYAWVWCPPPRFNIFSASEEKDLPVPYGYWSVITMVFKKKIAHLTDRYGRYLGIIPYFDSAMLWFAAKKVCFAANDSKTDRFAANYTGYAAFCETVMEDCEK